jgi:hypothetical protein
VKFIPLIVYNSKEIRETVIKCDVVCGFTSRVKEAVNIRLFVREMETKKGSC